MSVFVLVPQLQPEMKLPPGDNDTQVERSLCSVSELIHTPLEASPSQRVPLTSSLSFSLPHTGLDAGGRMVTEINPVPAL